MSEYRAFVVAHTPWGYIVLRSHKSKKGVTNYGQCPGGRLDDHEVPAATDNDAVTTDAFKRACCRELFEETGIDLRSAISRLQPIPFPHPTKRFFTVELSEGDFPTIDGGGAVGLRLSHEHVGWLFVQTKEEVAELVKHHSGGDVGRAVMKLSSL
eukprot:PhM_4_TR4341/c0_g1_i1/m.33186